MNAATILARPCPLCGRALRILVNRNTKQRSTIWACEHCDVPCKDQRRCPDCVQVARALRS